MPFLMFFLSERSCPRDVLSAANELIRTLCAKPFYLAEPFGFSFVRLTQSQLINNCQHFQRLIAALRLEQFSGAL